jgi:hypothetical protein
MAFSSKHENNYDSQLEQTAGEVDSYIVKTDGALKRFREQIKPLAQRWKAYYEAVDKREKELLEHWEKVKKNPKLQDKNMEPSDELEWDRFYLHGLGSFGSNPINEMPAKYALDVMASLEKYLERNEKNEQGYSENSSEYKRLQETIAKQRQDLEDIRSEFDKLSSAQKKSVWIKTPPKTVIPNRTYVKFTWWRYLNLPDEKVFGCWRPPLTPLPEHPLKILKPVESGYQRNQTRKELPDARNTQEEYERYYIFLSSVHDNFLQGVKKITEDIWSDNLPRAVLCCLDKGYGDKTAFLKAALERVCQSNHKIDKKKEQDTKREQEGMIEPKPPEFLQNLLWYIKYGLRSWKLILIAMIILGIFFCLKFGFHNKIFDLFKNKPLSSSERTLLNSRTRKRVQDAYETIEEEKLNPWIWINIDKMRPVTMHNGKVISCKGVLFEGSPRLVFWSDDFIPPFIEDAIVKVFDETIEECYKGNLEPKPYIDEANRLLGGFIWKVYNRMADIDQKLSRKGDSRKAGRKDISFQTAKMEKCLKGHYDAAVLLASEKINTTTPESEKEKGGWGLIKKIGLILGIIVSLVLIYEAYDKYIPKKSENQQQSTIKPKGTLMKMEWDVFICHASEDKEEFVQPLAISLISCGLKVWYDEFTLTVGDSLRGSIDKGLANSRYGIVVISPSFFSKDWPQKELNGLAALEANGRKVILPVWHKIDAIGVRKYSPTLADRFATSSKEGIEKVVKDILKALDISAIANSIPEYPKDMTDQSEIQLMARVIRNEIIKYLRPSWLRSKLLITELSQSFPKHSVVDELHRMKEDGLVSWGSESLEDNPRVSLTKTKS